MNIIKIIVQAQETQRDIDGLTKELDGLKECHDRILDNTRQALEVKGK